MFRFIEGAAGTGKTHTLIESAKALVNDGVLGPHGKILALTFMNGARRRLEGKLSASLLRGRFECYTLDSFAKLIVTRRTSLLATIPDIYEISAELNNFDASCFLATSLLGVTSVEHWVAASFPLIIVDEAQDLDDLRFDLLRVLANKSSILACADDFQCLQQNRDTSQLFQWLRGAGERVVLDQCRRTEQLGLLTTAMALRDAQDVPVLLRSKRRNEKLGIRIIDVVNRDGIAAWNVANEMTSLRGHTAILTPNSNAPIIKSIIEKLNTRTWKWPKGGTFGPFRVLWESRDDEVAARLVDELSLPDELTFEQFRRAYGENRHPAIIAVIKRMDRLRRVTAKTNYARAEVSELLSEVVRTQFRLGFHNQGGNLALTIHQAKNREFANVIVLWPYAVAGNAEQLRRLLYNAVTRAQNHCTIVVLGKGRMGQPPFAAG